MSAEMLADIVGTLVEMDLVDLDEPGPWPGEPEGQVVHEVDWAEVLSPSGREGSVAPVVSGQLDDLGDEMKRRISEGFHTPPEKVLDAQAW